MSAKAFRPLTTIILYHRIENLSIENGKFKCTKFRQILVRKLCNLHKNAQIDPAAAAVGPVEKKKTSAVAEVYPRG